jgi:hypothetical protein
MLERGAARLKPLRLITLKGNTRKRSSCVGQYTADYRDTAWNDSISYAIVRTCSC